LSPILQTLGVMPWTAAPLTPLSYTPVHISITPLFYSGLLKHWQTKIKCI